MDRFDVNCGEGELNKDMYWFELPIPGSKSMLDVGIYGNGHVMVQWPNRHSKLLSMTGDTITALYDIE